MALTLRVIMNLRPLLPDPTRGQRPATADWQETQPGELPASAPVAARRHPPLTELLQGLDARELEGQTVFDQLFGQPPPAAR